jgi:hypothetical protein
MRPWAASRSRGRARRICRSGRAAQRRLGWLLVHVVFTPGESDAPRLLTKTDPRSKPESVGVGHTPPSSTTATSAWADASSVLLTSCRASRIGVPTSRAWRVCRIGGPPASSWTTGIGAGAWHDRARRCPCGDRPARRREGRELLPRDQRSVCLLVVSPQPNPGHGREPWVRARPVPGEAPLGGREGRPAGLGPLIAIASSRPAPQPS